MRILTAFAMALCLFFIQPVTVHAPVKDMKPKPQTPTVLVSRGGSLFEPQEVGYIVTAYTSGPESTGKRQGDQGYGITASGKPAVEGQTCACPKELPFGTRIHIEGIGWRVCEDRGEAIAGNHIDLFVQDLNAAIKFGKQKLKVTIEGSRNQ